MAEIIRCKWSLRSPEETHYHDTEWGVPLHDSQKLFEFFVLDAFQAGLSWMTVLRKRENFRKAFDDFNPEKIARYNQKKLDKLMLDEGIIRNKLKITATVTNAQKYLELEESGKNFSEYLWSFVNHKPIVNKWKDHSNVPATSKESDSMSKALSKYGFKFVGSTICYAFMQAAGLVNDHSLDCFRRKELLKK
jgi:DNA-3-methyladenine glycosylase I